MAAARADTYYSEGGSSADKVLLDLGFLTEEERVKLEQVLQEDHKLVMQDRVRLGGLRQEVAKNRFHQQQFADKKQCTICEIGFTSILRTGAKCPLCGNQVCKKCRYFPPKPPPKFKCTVCHKENLLTLQSSEYEALDEDDVCGSELVRRSLRMDQDSVSSRSTISDASRHSTSNTTRSPTRLSVGHQSSSSSPGVSTDLSSTRDALNTTSGNTTRSAHTFSTSRRSSTSSLGVRSSPGLQEPRRSSTSSYSLSSARRLSPSELSDLEREDGEENSRRATTIGVLPAHLELRRVDSVSSFGSVSLYSAAGVTKGDYDISGEVLVGVEYKQDQLMVHVNRARGLAAADKNGLSDPYVKTYLLPDKSKTSKRKTKIKKKTLDPVYQETLKYKLPYSELLSQTIWLSVWDYDRFGRNQFLGEVHLPLSSVDLTYHSEQWYTLTDREVAVIDDQYKGEVLIGLKYIPSHGKGAKAVYGGNLQVAVKQARDLAMADRHTPTSAFVKCYLLPDRSHGGKRKTRVVRDTASPVWEEHLSYDRVNLEQLSRERVLELSIWDYNLGTSNRFIGGLRLGPFPTKTHKKKEWMDCIGAEVSHWEGMLAHPSQWVEQWHTLRPSMEPRDIDYSTLDDGAISHPIPITEVAEEESVSPTTPLEKMLSLSDVGSLPMRVEENEDEEGKEIASSIPDPSAIFQSKESKLTSSVASAPHELMKVKGLKHSHSASSFGSLVSIGEAVAAAKGDYDISGEVLVGVEYKQDQLMVHVIRARGLAAADKNGLSDPYVKTYLLPDKSKTSKRKTKTKKKTLDPVYQETLKYKLPYSELLSQTIWLSVWDYDRFGRNQFLGEVHLPLSSVDLTYHSEQWYTLTDRTLSVVLSKLPVDDEEDEKYETGPVEFEKVTVSTTSRADPPQPSSTTLSDPIKLASPLLDDRQPSQQPDHQEHSPSPPPSPESHEETKKSSSSHEIQKESVRPSDSPLASSVRLRSYSSTSQATRPSQDSPKIVNRHSSIPLLKPAMRDSPLMTHHRIDSPALPTISSSSPSPPSSPPAPVTVTRPSPSIPDTVPLQFLQRSAEEHRSFRSISSVGSFGSSLSLYSDIGAAKGDYDISGEVLVGVEYKQDQLMVHVIRARGLAAADKNGLSDPYVKTYLLPDKSKTSKRKTKIKKKTLDPVYKETLKYKLPYSELLSQTIWLSVWDYDRFGRNQFLGEVHLPLSSVDLTYHSEQWYTLIDRSS